jgi:hypothetical protein
MNDSNDSPSVMIIPRMTRAPALIDVEFTQKSRHMFEAPSLAFMLRVIETPVP